LTCDASRSSAAAELGPAARDVVGDLAVGDVFQAYYPMLGEAAAALDRAAQSVSAHLAGAHQVPRKAETVLSS